MNPDPAAAPDAAFSSLTFKTPINNYFSRFFCLLHFEEYIYIIISKKVKKQSQNSSNQGFSYYFLPDDSRIRISHKRISIRGPKTFGSSRFQIHNTASYSLYMKGTVPVHKHEIQTFCARSI